MLRRRALVALAVAAFSQGVGAGSARKERAEAPAAKPVVIGAVRYEAPHFARSQGLPYNGGWVVAYDAATHARLWVAAIYGLSGPADMEQDKREVFIVKLRPEADGRHLTVIDERSRRWRLDLRTRHVTRLKLP